jgi:hypothetical protein
MLRVTMSSWTEAACGQGGGVSTAFHVLAVLTVIPRARDLALQAR